MRPELFRDIAPEAGREAKVGFAAGQRTSGTCSWPGLEIYLRFVVVARGNLLRCLPMNILIENEATLEYLASGGKWTKNPSEGKSFPATRPAFRAAKQEAIGRFNIVCHIPQTNQFINLDHGRGAGLPAVGTEESSDDNS